MIEAAECRTGIISDFAKWTALSALRSGAPIKSRADVYGLLDKVPFAIVLGGQAEMSIAAFDAWHEDATAVMCARESRLSTGWAVKLINVYLKTAAYVGDLGRPVLRAALHPPIDAGLWAGLSARFCDDRELLAQTHCVSKIKDLATYAIYRRIIVGCRTAADRLGCELIEVEQLWQGARAPVSKRTLHQPVDSMKLASLAFCLIRPQVSYGVRPQEDTYGTIDRIDELVAGRPYRGARARRRKLASHRRRGTRRLQ